MNAVIYVDDPMRIGGRFNNYCHMWTDGTIEVLHAFADQIGLKRTWFQDRPEFLHYDISLSKRGQALKRGAVYMALRDWIIYQKMTGNARAVSTSHNVSAHDTAEAI